MKRGASNLVKAGRSLYFKLASSFVYLAVPERIIIMNNNELFNAWLNLTKYHERLLKAMDYKLQEQFQLGMKEFTLCIT